MKNPLRLIGPLLVFLVFAGAAWLLVRQLKHYDFQQVVQSLRQIPVSHLVAAVGITIINYLILVGYDVLAVRFVGQTLAFWRVALASFTGYACSYNFGATLAGATIRYRLYSAWGVPIIKVLQLLVILGLTFWFGVFALAGVIFVFSPLRIPEDKLAQICAQIPPNLGSWFRMLFADSRPFGIALLLLAILYVGTSAVHKGSLTIFRWQLPVPPFRLTVYQVAIASADMLVAGWLLYVLFPALKGGYVTVLAIYLVAYVLVVLSHVPGGWGVLELVMLSLVEALELAPNPEVDMPHAIAGLVVFRVIYFFIPLLVALILLGVHELSLRGKWGSPQSSPPSAPSDDQPTPHTTADSAA